MVSQSNLRNATNRQQWKTCYLAEILTVGKYPKVNTLRRLVLPQAPSPMITSFLEDLETVSQFDRASSGKVIDYGMLAG